MRTISPKPVRYELIIYWSKDDESFVVEVPELPGCMADGQTYAEAIANLSPHDKALLTGELFAMNAKPDSAALEAALERGLKDVEAVRVRPVAEVKTMLPRWTSKS